MTCRRLSKVGKVMNEDGKRRIDIRKEGNEEMTEGMRSRAGSVAGP